MTTYKAQQLAKKRGGGTFKAMSIYVDCYNSSGKFQGSNQQRLHAIQTEAVQRFARHFEAFKNNLLFDGWDCKVSFIFGDD